MQFHKGDKVRFLNETGEGMVTRLMGNGMVMVAIEDGFEYPYPANQLVPAQPVMGKMTGEKVKEEKGRESGESDETDEEKQTGKAVTASSPGMNSRYPDGIYLAFIPQHQHFPSAGKIDVVFYNHSDYDIYYTLSLKDGSSWICIQSGALGPRRHAEIDTLTPQQIDEWGALKTDVLFFSSESYRHRAPVSDLLRLKGVKFFKDTTYNDHLLTGNRAYVSEIMSLEETAASSADRTFLTNDDIHRMLKEKEKNTTGKKTSVPHLKNQSLEKEVDLHIEELLDNWSGMSNAQLLDIQLKRVVKELDEAIAMHMRRVIFIHGVGNGRLKQEVRRVLSGYKGIRFHDASFRRYGFGATEVEIL